MGNICCTDHQFRRGTLVPNMKHYKQLKQVEDIGSLFQITSLLGKGSFGSVNKAIRISTNTECAIKHIRKQTLYQQSVLVKLMMQELSVLQKCSHPNIMNVMEMYEDENYFYIVTEQLEGGELFDRIMEVKSFSEQKAA